MLWDSSQWDTGLLSDMDFSHPCHRQIPTTELLSPSECQLEANQAVQPTPPQLEAAGCALTVLDQWKHPGLCPWIIL